MATTTPNFGWSVPTSTDLVKDGATAIETLGDSIDASMVDLKGGTSGQILAKNSNTDMDFVWIANDQGDLTAVSAGVGITITNGTGPIPTITNSSTDLITTAGDILYGTAADTVARLGIGTAGQVLAVNSGATAPQWQAAPSSSTSLSEIASGTFSGSSLTFSSLTLDTYIFMSRSATFDLSAAASLQMKINSIATGYRYASFYTDGTSAEPSNSYTAAGTIWQSVLTMNNNAGVGQFYFIVQNCKEAGYTRYSWDMSYRRNGSTNRVRDWGWGVVETNAQATSLTFDISAGTWSNGSYSLYGA